MIPLHFLARYAVPLIVAAVYLGDVDIPLQIRIMDKTMRLTDEALSKGRGEGEGTETFDFIIVGGGSAGAVLANRLTASGEHTVLLLEAGGDPHPLRDIPHATHHAWGSDSMSWGYTTVKQENICERSEGVCSYAFAKSLGGTSSTNGLIYNRAKSKDLDGWGSFTGDESWSWRNVKDTYDSIEDYHGFYEESANGRHGFGGEMYVGKLDYLPGIDVVEEALEEKGLHIGDMNGLDQSHGFSRIDRNIKDGLRWGTYRAFLEPILNRPNLSIYRYALAIKIETVVGDKGLRATGVTYQRHGSTFTAWASKEVLLSAGFAESPKLLLLSGIGPKDHLDEVGLPTVLDLPAVGQHLHEHVACSVMADNGGFLVNTSFSVDHNTTEAVLQYLQNGTGPLGQFNWGGGQTPQLAMGSINSRANSDVEWPDIQVWINSRYFPDQNRQEFYFSVTLHRTSTTGTIKLASKDPMVQPLIDPNSLGNLADVERIVDGIEATMDVFFNTTAFKNYDIQPMGSYSQCSSFEHLSRDFWRCYVQRTASLDNHPTSTCRMGPDRTVAVVDSKLRVFGTENLRIIDASSIPFGPSGNTNLPVLLVAARGAEIIISEQRQLK